MSYRQPPVMHEDGSITLGPHPFGTAATWADYNWRGLAENERRGDGRPTVASMVFDLIADACRAGSDGMSAQIGPHDLVISAGDCEFYGSCSCGKTLGAPTRPNESFNVHGERWERHVMTEHRDCDCEPCSW